MMKSIFNNADKKKVMSQTTATPVNDTTSDNIVMSRQIPRGVFSLTSQMSKDFEALLKQEANITYGLRELLGGSAFTTQQIELVGKHLLSFTENSEKTKGYVAKVFDSLENSSNEIDYAKVSIDNVVHQMTSVTAVFHQFLDVFLELEAQYKDISNFANVITSMAKQTNLLSLNASIEAARAGEAGKGFSVVASEIKKLSDETDKNAKDIIGTLNRMTLTIKELSTRSNSGVSVVNDATELIQKTNNQVDKIFVAENIVQEHVKQVQLSQEQNLTEVQDISKSLLNIAEKSNYENDQLELLILSVQEKSDYYLTILNQLNQIKLLKNLLD